MKGPSRENDYVVRDANDDEWGRYLYPAMAQQVADRCNSDASLADRQPYTVTPEPAT